jgi:uncharacterized protein
MRSLVPAPVAPAERIQVLDVIRGFALLGILSVNMALFSHPVQTIFLPVAPDAPFLERASVFLVRFLAEGKFYALFSALFGLGFYLLIDRLSAKGLATGRIYLRRLLALLGFGVAHALLLWVGDILVVYALCGLVLWLFRRARPRTLLIWAAVFIVLPLMFYAASTGLIAVARSAGPQSAAAVEAALNSTVEGAARDAQAATLAYRQPSYMAVTAQRWRDWSGFLATANLTLIPNVLAMFLVGLYFGKRKLIANAAANLPLFRRLLVIGLAIGLPLNFPFALYTLDQSRAILNPQTLLAMVGQGLGAPFLTLAYVSAVILLAHAPATARFMAFLAPVGRMALTNYLLQSLICSTIFYGYGLGLFGQIGTAAGLVLAVVIYALQIPLSNWWLSHFRFGPAEWLWRTLTYLRLQPMRKEQPGQPRARAVA